MIAIGGINEKNVALLRPANIDGIAVVSAILTKKSVKIAAEKLVALIRL